MLKEFELCVISNEWNWIDCFGPNLENCKIATVMKVSMHGVISRKFR